MYPFSILTDEHVPLKFLITNSPADNHVSSLTVANNTFLLRQPFSNPSPQHGFSRIFTEM